MERIAPFNPDRCQSRTYRSIAGPPWMATCAAALACWCMPAQAQERVSLFGYQLEQVVDTRTTIEFGLKVDTKILPDGGLVVVDLGGRRISRLDSLGGVIWHRGRDGDGPGEYRFPYRVAIHPDGRFLVYDRSRNDLTWLDSGGTERSRRRLPFPVEPVDDMLVLSNGHIVLSGVTHWGGEAADHAVHVFDEELRHVRSFAELPAISDRRKLGMWGAGSVSMGGEDTFWYSRAGPLELIRMTGSGQILGHVPLPYAPPSGRWDDVYSLTPRGGITVDRSSSVRAGPVHEWWDGRLLVTVQHSDGSRIEIHHMGGEHIQDVMPEAWSSLVGIDRGRSMLWVNAAGDVPGVIGYRVLSGER